MLLERGRDLIERVKGVFDSNLEVGRIYELKDHSPIRKVKLLTVYNNSILTIPKDLQGQIVYGKLDQNGNVIEEVTCSKEDFEKLYIKLPKGLDVTDNVKRAE